MSGRTELLEVSVGGYARIAVARFLKGCQTSANMAMQAVQILSSGIKRTHCIDSQQPPERVLLQRVAVLSGDTLWFRDDELHGSAWIGGMPIDIEVVDGHVVLHSVGKFSGNSKSLSKGEWRGRGKFKALVPHIKKAMVELGYCPELYLFPLSPVWENCYDLNTVSEGVRGCYHKIVF